MNTTRHWLLLFLGLTALGPLWSQEAPQRYQGIIKTIIEDFDAVVAGRPAGGAGSALAAQADGLAVLDPGRDGDIERFSAGQSDPPLDALHRVGQADLKPKALVLAARLEAGAVKRL